MSASGGDFVIPLPCASWSVNAAGTRYRYSDPSGATCRTVIIKDGALEKAVCKGPQVAYEFTGTPPVPVTYVHVVVTTGDVATQRKACATFEPGTATVVKDGSDGQTYKALNAGAPATCP